MQVRWAGDRCSVCDSDVDFDSDQLVSCDMCGITVHQSCYGVPELPGVDDMWLCRACELKVRMHDKLAHPIYMGYVWALLATSSSRAALNARLGCLQAAVQMIAGPSDLFT